MKILQIVPQVPYPLTNGGRIGIFNITKYLALRGHSVVMLAIDHGGGAEFPELRRYCLLKAVPHDTRSSLAGMARNLFSGQPYTISKYHSKDVERELQHIVVGEQIDIVHVDHLHMAFYGELVKRRWGLPVVLRQHNVETAIWERLYLSECNPVKKAYVLLQCRRMKDYEKEMCRVFDRILAITEDDMGRIKQFDSSIKTSVIPAGVDTDYFHPQDVKEESGRLVFVGSMDWMPNVDGIQWFVKQVFARIQRECPGVKLTLIGSNPGREMAHLCNPGIEIRSNVPDVREYVGRSEVVIVPLRIGGGMRLKILEALAMKKAVVSTSVGCEGIDVRSEREILVADDEETFATCVLRLIGDKDFREKLASRGHERVLSKYSWGRIAQSLENEYQDVITKHRETTGLSIPTEGVAAMT